MSQIESSRNIIIRAVENNQTLKFSGVFAAAFSLLDLLIQGNTISPDKHAIVVAVGIIGIVAASLGEETSANNP